MKTYHIKGKATGVSFIVTYDDEVLTAIQFEGEYSIDQYKYIGVNIPYNESVLEIYKNNNRCFEVVEIPQEICFDVFWDKYANKQDKQVAERSWKRLNKTDRIAVIDSIRHYDRYLDRVSYRSKMLPSKYLNGRHFETDWRKMNA